MYKRALPLTPCVIAGLMLAILVAALPFRPGVAYAASPPDISQPVNTSCANGTLPDPRGVKSWLLREALEYMAAAIRSGNFIIQKIIGYLDKKAAKAFREYADDIADGLDDIAKIPDLTMNIVREKLRYFLTDQLKINHGTAEVIVGAVETVLGTFL